MAKHRSKQVDKAVFVLEDADGTTALILELIEGDTLAERLQRGAIPVADAPGRLGFRDRQRVVRRHLRGSSASSRHQSDEQGGL